MSFIMMVLTASRLSPYFAERPVNPAYTSSREVLRMKRLPLSTKKLFICLILRLPLILM
ncbi:hypothetical protein SDC9_109717 [bioreactor metagenome]|uniref:Uncharacterized protein n=1 Tax=bioreactor metagenome TaxID=1076179 RepID=A0A645BBI7_9ZZZZ